MGVRCVKIAPFEAVTPGSVQLSTGQRGLELISSLRDRYPDLSIRVDFHERFTPENALALLPALDALDLDAATRLVDAGAILLDGRTPEEFARGHLIGAVNVGLDGRYAEFAGSVVPSDVDIVLVADPGFEIEARNRLGRIGFDRVVGHLAGYRAGFMMSLPTSQRLIHVPTPLGSVELKIPPGSRSGSRLRLKGRGIPAAQLEGLFEPNLRRGALARQCQQPHHLLVGFLAPGIGVDHPLHLGEIVGDVLEALRAVHQIGEVLGVSESRVCQIHTKAIMRLRSKLSGVKRGIV